MIDNTDAPQTELPGQGRRPKREALLAVLTVALVAVAVGAVMFASGNNSTAPVGGRASIEPQAPAGLTSVSCVEIYDLKHLANREKAFDGTVKTVEGDRVSFTVNHWYRGGGETQIVLAGAKILGGITSAGDPISLDPGTRLLVSGDGGFAWGCGFTRPYTENEASEWSRATS